jgi:polysaccharide pyruvyl transferase WcaK-like protein
MKILIIGGDNGGGNIGDEAMCEVAYSFFRKNISNVDIIIDAQNINWKSENNDLKVIKQLRKDDYKTAIGKYISFLLKIYRILFLPVFCKIKSKIPLFFHGNEIKYYLQNVDLVFFSGCGNITDKYPINVLAWWAIIKSARKLKKPVVISGIGIGPLQNKLLKVFVKDFIDVPEYITTRDKNQSLKYLKEFGRDYSFEWVVDDAFYYEVTKKYTLDYSRQKKVGLSLMRQVFRNYQEMTLFISQIKTVLLKFPDLHLYLVSLSPDDQETLMQVKQEISNSTLLPYLNISETKDVISQFDLMITSRYHGAVFSISQNVPTIGIFNEEYWRNKLNGLFDMLNIKDNLFKTEELYQSSFYNIIQEYLNNKDSFQLKMNIEKGKLNQKKLVAHRFSLNFLK